MNTKRAQVALKGWEEVLKPATYLRYKQWRICTTDQGYQYKMMDLCLVTCWSLRIFEIKRFLVNLAHCDTLVNLLTSCRIPLNRPFSSCLLFMCQTNLCSKPFNVKMCSGYKLVQKNLYSSQTHFRMKSFGRGLVWNIGTRLLRNGLYLFSITVRLLYIMLLFPH